jgi:hypothetical protein
MSNTARISVPCSVPYRGFTIVLAGDPSMSTWTVQTAAGPVATGYGACGFDQDDDTGEFVGAFQNAFEDAYDRAVEHADYHADKAAA